MNFGEANIAACHQVHSIQTNGCTQSKWNEAWPRFKTHSLRSSMMICIVMRLSRGSKPTLFLDSSIPLQNSIPTTVIIDNISWQGSHSPLFVRTPQICRVLLLLSGRNFEEEYCGVTLTVLTYSTFSYVTSTPVIPDHSLLSVTNLVNVATFTHCVACQHIIRSNVYCNQLSLKRLDHSIVQY